METTSSVGPGGVVRARRSEVMKSTQASTSSVAAARARWPAKDPREGIEALSVEWALRVARVFRNVCATAWRNRSANDRSHGGPWGSPRARSRCGKATTSGFADLGYEGGAGGRGSRGLLRGMPALSAARSLPRAERGEPVPSAAREAPGLAYPE